MAVPAIEPPARRPLRVFAFDPMFGKGNLNVVTIDLENEPLLPGPAGNRVVVVDYDVERKTYYPPVDLDDPVVLMQSGLAPSEADPRFHQQMVYAVTLKVLENFDRALGRRLRFKEGPLRLFPTRCNRPTPSTTASSTRFCSATSPRGVTTQERTCRGRPCSPVCRRTSSPTRSPTR